MDILEPGLLNCPEEAVLPPPVEKKKTMLEEVGNCGYC
jgi:hypothetical protein